MSTTYETKPCPTRLTLRVRADDGALPPGYEPIPCEASGLARLKIVICEASYLYNRTARASGECDIEIDLATVRDIAAWANVIVYVADTQARLDAGLQDDRDESR
jgi:hypothetical protein